MYHARALTASISSLLLDESGFLDSELRSGAKYWNARMGVAWRLRVAALVASESFVVACMVVDMVELTFDLVFECGDSG